MLQTDGQTDKVQSYNSLPTPWRGINKEFYMFNFERYTYSSVDMLPNLSRL